MIKKKEKLAWQKASYEELMKLLSETEQNLVTHVSLRYTKQSKNTREGKHIKNRLAVLSSIVRQKELSHA